MAQYTRQPGFNERHWQSLEPREDSRLPRDRGLDADRGLTPCGALGAGGELAESSMLWHSGAMVTIDDSAFDDDRSDPSGPDDDDLNRFADPTGHCPACGAEMWDDAPACPSCGELTGGQTLTHPPRQTEQRRLALAAVAIIVVVALLLLITRCSVLLGPS